MNSDNQQTQKQAHPAAERGGWADYVEAQLDLRERTERLRALRLQKQAAGTSDHEETSDH